MELHLNVFASGDQARVDHPAEHVVLAALGVDADKVDLGKSVFRTNLIDVAELSIGSYGASEHSICGQLLLICAASELARIKALL